ncbi:hypothetical protein B0T21DRAFT_351995 [Apiosordaria backusii]|uniref:Uncharacterized protein n=1 Tax=Apiosordaria backusii TaxID=314023 RepID=A0AA40DV03_9PEZI|nr:hypothetical protein B0T21DRAFT_351995 [Apiosordaria backusii]
MRQVKVQVYAGTIAAHWAPSVLTILPREINEIGGFRDPNSKMGPSIKMLDIWGIPPQPRKPRLYHHLLDPFKFLKPLSYPLHSRSSNEGGQGDKHYTQFVLQKILSTVLTDGLARDSSYGTNHAVYLFTNDTSVNIQNIGSYHGMDSYHFQFDFSGKPGIGLPVKVLLLKSPLASSGLAGYYRYDVNRKKETGRGIMTATILAWGSVETLFLLLWNSTLPPKLEAPFSMEQQMGGKSLRELSRRDVTVRADEKAKARMHFIEDGIEMESLESEKKYL